MYTCVHKHTYCTHTNTLNSLLISRSFPNLCFKYNAAVTLLYYECTTTAWTFLSSMLDEDIEVTLSFSLHNGDSKTYHNCFNYSKVIHIMDSVYCVCYLGLLCDKCDLLEVK